MSSGSELPQIVVTHTFQHRQSCPSVADNYVDLLFNREANNFQLQLSSLAEAVERL